jgi:hypothetical protein
MSGEDIDKRVATDNRIINTIRLRVMHNNLEGALEKALMRMSGGSRTKAYSVIRDSMEHYGYTRDMIKDFHIDCALGDLNGGIEVEWPQD